jgi:hypothetical protein
MSQQVCQVAGEFCRLLKTEIGEKKLAAVIERNRNEPHPGVCHSHDFIDANEVMGAVFKKFRLNWRLNTATWNKAWNIAKAAEFNPDRLSL